MSPSTRGRADRESPPDVELTPTDAGWEVLARLPGIAPEEVALDVDGRELHIRARSEAEVNADLGIGETGFRARGFDYRVDLPDHVDLEHVDAVMDHGLLTVTLPRAAPSTGRTPGAARPAVRSLGAADPAADRELHHPDVAADDLTALRHRE